MREIRETASPPVAAGGREEKAMSYKSSMHGGGESSDCIVPAKSANKRRGTLGGAHGGKAVSQGDSRALGRCWTPCQTIFGNSSPSGVRADPERAGRAYFQGGNRVC
jgi:hypothetical protein